MLRMRLRSRWMRRFLRIVAVRWDRGGWRRGCHSLSARASDRVCPVAYVGKPLVRIHLNKGGHSFEGRAVRRFGARKVAEERDAAGITETMTFTGEPAPRATQSPFASPTFAPAAET